MAVALLKSIMDRLGGLDDQFFVLGYLLASIRFSLSAGGCQGAISEQNTAMKSVEKDTASILND